ncbi:MULTISPECIES: glucosylglycerol 3-phosphatase [unclassified Coleofasciculus]|uniref:glucosylglycerol 3-phosphatase n=1 Tax=unclassified Coleofasciculus TaxID=2692782 RepID=UPI001880A92B|nr:MULTISPECIES: glucosylglycerol 3-phosphatase [unclassified Coleofasciculus]MBE9126910.1 glucosylglycerol 3-phosphatase [Coleofasciculus sp. LEGE 07081]MBE9150194.1 glucosylglycerol 3-phosphatase [Coleofasciculus sp. LEGE 07092]
MNSSPHILLHEPSLSLRAEKLAHVLTSIDNLLIIQDLDGVCMGLVKDPLTRVIDTNYVNATKLFDGHFYVLTNGEHIGKRGVNGIIERAFGDQNYVKEQSFYLPGLAAGGVQWQDRHGTVSHPGVSDEELAFLEEVPQRIKDRLRQFFEQHDSGLEVKKLDECIQASVLDNKASPTANLNTFYETFGERSDIYIALQKDMQGLMMELLQDAEKKGLNDSFFVHYAPNLGRDAQGDEILRPARGKDSGTTDFQFMIRGAIKEAGVLVILNRYYFQRTGTYPLGEGFNVRQAPRTHQELLNLVKTNFDPQAMPIIVGVGDTVTSLVEEEDGCLQIRRGGSDRNFLQLVQDIGEAFNKGNIIVYVDSSRGEVKNRKAVKVGSVDNGEVEAILAVLEGPGDARDVDEPLILNMIFANGHEQYTSVFQSAARGRQLLYEKQQEQG